MYRVATIINRTVSYEDISDICNICHIPTIDVVHKTISLI